jgi:hypothetical protein
MTVPVILPILVATSQKTQGIVNGARLGRLIAGGGETSVIAACPKPDPTYRLQRLWLLAEQDVLRLERPAAIATAAQVE